MEYGIPVAHVDIAAANRYKSNTNTNAKSKIF
jgi:hypothetical protein